METRETLGALVRGVYELQQLRIQTGLRIVATFKRKLGQMPSEPEEELSKDAKELLKVLRLSYTKISEAMVAERKRFTGEGLIDQYSEYALIESYIHLEKEEKQVFKHIETVLQDFPIYTQFLKEVKGIGPALASVIISEFNIHKANYASSLIKYAGLDVAPDGKGRSKRSEHLIDVEYKAKDGTTKTKKSITFNPFLKAKLLGVLGPSFLKVKESPYKEMYYNYKHRLENHPDHKDKTLKHRHNMAIRYMVRRFLIDLYTHWRGLEGLVVHPPYEVGKLGMVHSKAA